MGTPNWFKSLFGVKKPVIAMAHLSAPPGTPRYNPMEDIECIVDRVLLDIKLLLEAGVDAVMFCNEDDRPYVFEASFEQLTTMTRVIAETAPKSVPFGVDFLWDPIAALAIAKATGGAFIREVLTGVYESDMGMWSPNPGKVARFRRQIDANNVKVFYNIVPEFASPLGNRSVVQRAKSAIVSCMADAILVSGAMAGQEPDLDKVSEAAQAAADEIPILLNTGAKVSNIYEYLKIADGVIVGSSLKVDGYTWNPVDPLRVEAFMAEVKRAREN
jgi:uncharacterized protein